MSDIAMGARSLRRLTSVLAIFSILLGGCVQNGEDADASALTPAEQQLRAKAEEKRKVEAATGGAVAGAVAGALIGALLGARGGNAAMGALVGAAAGGALGAAAGLAYGSYMNAKARKYSNDEARAQAISKGADETLVYYNEVNASAETILQEQQAKVTRLNEEYRNKTITKEQFQKELASSNRNETILKDQLKSMDEQINSMKTDQQSEQLGRQIAQLEQQREALRQKQERYLQLLGSVPSEVRVPSQS